MATNTNTTTGNKIEAGYETSTFALGVGIVTVAFVGLWGVACLTSATVSMGPLGVVRAYFTAIVG